jgi:hypothetical protein
MLSLLHYRPRTAENTQAIRLIESKAIYIIFVIYVQIECFCHIDPPIVTVLILLVLRTFVK